MDNKKIDTQKLIKYWIESSDDDYDIMLDMYNAKRYSWSLFIGHLMIEKLLKALYVNNKLGYPPYIHNLLRLAEKADIKLDSDKKEQLVTITAFNINARYDDYKMSFKNRCTLEFTAEWIDKLKGLRKWIKQLINQ